MGAAIDRNPVSIVVPCHRVVGADGRLTGYGWGLERKAWLRYHERWACSAKRAGRPRQKEGTAPTGRDRHLASAAWGRSTKVMLQQSSTAEGGGLVSRVSSRIWVQRNTAICRLWV